MINDAAIHLNDVIKSKNVQLSVDELPNVIGRRIRLTEMFRQLLSNAVKFGKNDTPVQIHIAANTHRTVDDKEYTMISIADNGIGFDQKYQDKIFELFQKLHSQDKYSGSGIGLSLCKKIIEDHSGYISVVSEVGKGSTFSVFLPTQR